MSDKLSEETKRAIEKALLEMGASTVEVTKLAAELLKSRRPIRPIPELTGEVPTYLASCRVLNSMMDIIAETEMIIQKHYVILCRAMGDESVAVKATDRLRERLHRFWADRMEDLWAGWEKTYCTQNEDHKEEKAK